MNGRALLKIDSVILALRLLLLMAFPLGVSLAEREAFGGDAGPAMQSRWSTSFSGGYAHQLDTDIDNGGSFSVNRFGISGSAGYAPDSRRSVSIAVGYNAYRYSASVRPYDGGSTTAGTCWRFPLCVSPPRAAPNWRTRFPAAALFRFLAALTRGSP